MSWEPFSTWLGQQLAHPLFHFAGTLVTTLSVLTFFLIILGTLFASWIVQRTMNQSMGRRFVGKEGTFASIKRLVHYLILLVGFGIALQTVGINMSALFAAGAVFAIAAGFAMQNIVQNFVSGIIILMERSIKPGDILEVEGTVVKVVDMGIRTTVVRTWKEEDLIMPNSIFSQSTVKNFTLRDDTFRLGVVVGVTYGSDMAKVAEVLAQTAKQMPWRLPDIKPSVMLQDFGSSSVDFGVYLSVSNPWKQRVYMSELRTAIWFAFKEASITIAFPQVDVHFDPQVSAGLSKLAKAM